MNTYEEISTSTHERVVYCENSDVGLKAFIAIHNTYRGPSLGGCRMWNYDTKEDALTDVLRLSQGMTLKNALADLNIGGGKSVIWGDSKTQKTPELLKAMGEFVEYIDGQYIIAEDIGMSVQDILTIREVTKFTPDPTAGDPGPTTALGVFIGIKTACKFKFGTNNLDSHIVVVQGAGSVGLALIKHLMKAGARVFVADINQQSINNAVLLGATPTNLEDIYNFSAASQADRMIFAPCALGAILNNDTIPLMNFSIIAGSANNQLLDETHGQMLFDKGILYAPDYVINAGGVIMIAGETSDGYDHAIVVKKVNKIGDTLTDIFRESYMTQTPTNIIADTMANKMLQD